MLRSTGLKPVMLLLGVLLVATGTVATASALQDEAAGVCQQSQFTKGFISNSLLGLRDGDLEATLFWGHPDNLGEAAYLPIPGTQPRAKIILSDGNATGMRITATSATGLEWTDDLRSVSGGFHTILDMPAGCWTLQVESDDGDKLGSFILQTRESG